jgi:sterol 3beta-glucosyltransferase
MAHITIIAFGTRGDVQPALALGKGLQAAGHAVRVLAGANFREWIAGHGLEAAPSRTDMQALIASEGGQAWIDSGNNPLAQTRMMKRLLAADGYPMIEDAWQASQGTDLLISSFTSEVYALSIAEKLGIKQATMIGQPALVATRDGRAVPNGPLPGRVSLINYLFGKLFLEPYPWMLLGKLNNRLRREVLGLPPQSRAESTAARKQLLTLLGYSRHVVPHPADWPANFHTVGFYFLDEENDWEPPDALLDFLAAGEAPVSIGFGSMTGRDPQGLTELVVDAVQRSGARAILLSGWAGLGQMDLPEGIFCLERAPHGWLFDHVAAVVHHGGAGTTAAGLRAGAPSVIVPHFVDQPFWGERVHALGAGPKPVPRQKLTAAKLGAAIAVTVGNAPMAQRASELAGKIAQEDGVAAAVGLVEGLLAE